MTKSTSLALGTETPNSRQAAHTLVSEAQIDPNVVYSLGRSRGESTRLQRQADELVPESSALLDRVAIHPGHRAIDIGCGPRGIIDLLSERVSPGGQVVGLDADPAHIAMAAEFAATRGLVDTEFVCADARHTGLKSGSFDLVHARTLLINVPKPGEVVAEMVRLARPGGWVAGLEPDSEVAICYPPDPAFDRLCDISAIAIARHGADPHLGRRMAELYRRAGLHDVSVEARATVYTADHSRKAVRADLARSMRSQILELGLAREQELDDLDRATRDHLDKPTTLVMPGLMFLAWGRKPAAG